jgi:hypothetical protein
MCAVVSVVLPILESLAAHCALPSLFYLCEVAEAVRAMGEKEPFIAIFVGTLPKTARGNCYDSS